MAYQTVEVRMARFHSTSNGNIPYTPEEEAEADMDMANEALASARRLRDKLLAECDWVTLRSYSRGEPVPADWAAYMQALRDVPQQPDPLSITWPARPAA